MLVQDAMTPHPVTVGASTSLEDAFAALAEHAVSAVPVVDETGHVLGVVSEADLLPDAYTPDQRTHLIPTGPEPARADRTVADVMSSPAVTVRSQVDVVDVVALMIEHGYKSLPVVGEHGYLLGIVSRSDLVRLRARSDDDIGRDVAALFHDLLHPRWTADVHDGVVDVAGPVTQDERELAEACAATVPGVVSVRTPPPR